MTDSNQDIDVFDTVELVDVDDIEPYDTNPKRHPPDQIRAIAKSIRTFGFTVPLVIDDDGVIVAGHGRYAAATKRIGMDTVPCIRRADLTDDQIRAFRLADNRVAESDWDNDLLAEELAAVDLADDDLFVATGSTDEEYDEILRPPDMDVPDSFDDVDDEAIETDHVCPECGYEW